MKKLVIILGIIIVVLLGVLIFAPAVKSPAAPLPTPPSPTGDQNVHVFSPKPGDEVSSPLMAQGEARGTWYFEASFPVKVLDADGAVLGMGHAEAEGDWMTPNFVPFKARVEFRVPKSATGILVLEKDNPSGLPEYAGEFRVSIRFKKQSGGQAQCRPTGCSGQICSDKDAITTCEYRSEYACYKTAHCERQMNGECGWTQTTELQHCLKEIGGGS